MSRVHAVYGEWGAEVFSARQVKRTLQLLAREKGLILKENKRVGRRLGSHTCRFVYCRASEDNVVRPIMRALVFPGERSVHVVDLDSNVTLAEDFGLFTRAEFIRALKVTES